MKEQSPAGKTGAKAVKAAPEHRGARTPLDDPRIARVGSQALVRTASTTAAAVISTHGRHQRRSRAAEDRNRRRCRRNLCR